MARSGLLSGSGVWGWCTVGSQALVHRPQGRSTVDRVHAGTGRAMHRVPGARGDGRLHFPPYFYSGVSPAAGRAGWRQIRCPPDTVVQLAWLGHVCECACVSWSGEAPRPSRRRRPGQGRGLAWSRRARVQWGQGLRRQTVSTADSTACLWWWSSSSASWWQGSRGIGRRRQSVVRLVARAGASGVTTARRGGSGQHDGDDATRLGMMSTN